MFSIDQLSEISSDKKNNLSVDNDSLMRSKDLVSMNVWNSNEGIMDSLESLPKEI